MEREDNKNWIAKDSCGGERETSYFDQNNQPTCNYGVYEQIKTWDTLWFPHEFDTSYMLKIKILDKKSC